MELPYRYTLSQTHRQNDAFIKKMKKNKQLLVIYYVLMDILAAVITWVVFFIFRKYNVNPEVFQHFSTNIVQDRNFWIGICLFPIYWFFLHLFIGYYHNIYRKSRLKELEQTLGVNIFGVILFFFVFILDDIVNSPSDYIRYFFMLFCCQFILTYLPRVLMTTHVNRMIHNGIIGFKTLIIGSDEVALSTYNSVIQQNIRSGNFIVGYVTLPDSDEHAMSKVLPCMGTIHELQEIIKKEEIEEIIIAIHNGQRKYIEEILSTIREISGITMSILPQTQDYLMGTIKMSSVFYEPLISINSEYMSPWQQYVKRMMDIVISLIAVILLLPVYLFLAIGVKCSSKGPVFYLQERIGYQGKPFKIIKFRSMYTDAEKNGPMLSSEDDNRITKFGRFLRHSRLDETPQFINVLKGEMSLVGPRPERQYYIDKIVEKAPYYRLLLGVKPGITSWGQVKFGYAENVDEMIERMRFDLLYLENMSIQMDIKILIYTVLIVLKNEGK